MCHKDLDFSDSTLKEGITLLRNAAASETLQNLLKLSDRRKQLQNDSYCEYTIDGKGEQVNLFCSSDKEAAKFFGLYMSHKGSLPKLDEGEKGLEVKVYNSLISCTYDLWRDRTKIYAECKFAKSAQKVSITATPTASILGPQFQTPKWNLLPEKDKELYILHEIYGYASFRQGQLEVIRSIMQGVDTLTLIPTGGGKSIIYTVPALLMQGLTVVVEPLKCIMEEQVEKLRQKQVPAFFYNSSLTEKEMDFTVNILCRKELTMAILFTSPECIMSAKMQKVLKKWNDAGRLSFIAVDEAHCVDIWGVGFRPDYLKLGSLKEFQVPLIALTGTATQRNQEKIISRLNMNCPMVIKTSNSRSNLHLQVLQKASKPKKQIADFINSNYQGQQGIVYCARRKDTVDLACELNQANIKAIYVHGDLKELERKRNIQAWSNRKADVMCATKSFGMGVDEKTVRFVIHMTFPESIQDYVQEIGWAGRDGQQSQCTVFFKHEDRAYHLHNIMHIEDEDHRLYKYRSMNEAIEFFDNTSACRHKKLLAYFEEFTDNCKNNCDICTAISPLHITQDCTIIAKSIVDGIKDIQKITDKISVKLLSQVLFGSSAIEIKSLGLDKSKAFGTVRSCYRKRDGKQKDLQRLIYHLLVIGVITEIPTGTPDRPSIVLKTADLDPSFGDNSIWY